MQDRPSPSVSCSSLSPLVCLRLGHKLCCRLLTDTWPQTEASLSVLQPHVKLQVAGEMKTTGVLPA